METSSSLYPVIDPDHRRCTAAGASGPAPVIARVPAPAPRPRGGDGANATTVLASTKPQKTVRRSGTSTCRAYAPIPKEARRVIERSFAHCYETAGCGGFICEGAKRLGAKPLEVGHLEMLGGIIRKANAAGYAMLTSSKRGERSVTMACGPAFLRVKQRLLLVYLYRRYESPETVTDLRKSLEEWRDVIVTKNT